MVEYKFEKVKGFADPLYIRGIIERGAKAMDSPASIMMDLKRSGVSYRKTNMLYDIGLIKSGIFGKTPEATIRGNEWFKNFFEPERIRAGMSRKEFGVFLRKGKLDRLETEEEEAEWVDLMGRTEGGTPPLD